MENPQTPHQHRTCLPCHLSGIEFGLLILLVGIFLAGKEMGWIHIPVSFPAVFFTLFGVLLIVKSVGKG